MKAILINVKNKEIKEVEHDNTLKSIYEHVECKTFDVVRIDDINSIFVDDDGLVNSDLYFRYFANSSSATLAGNGLILGVDDEGESISPTISVEEVKDSVHFLNSWSNNE